MLHRNKGLKMVEDEITTDEERTEELFKLIEAMRPFADSSHQKIVWMGKSTDKVDSFKDCLYELLGDGPDDDRLGDFMNHSMSKLELPQQVVDKMRHFHLFAAPVLLSIDLYGQSEKEALAHPQWAELVNKAQETVKTFDHYLRNVIRER